MIENMEEGQNFKELKIDIQNKVENYQFHRIVIHQLTV